MLEVDVDVSGPEPLLQFFACHHIAGVLQEHRQHLDRLALQLNAQPVFAQLTAVKIELECPETDTPARRA
jgi:hypothetical protein